ncbi:WD40-repeat-containing domain protein [Mycena floridula]|nr:WD40-repeat-containing domain protein [Mycena floridula]
MVKHARKRQKVSEESEATTSKYNPLLDDSAKDNEERRLESLLFGTEFIEDNVIEVGDDDDEEEGENAGAVELQNLTDADLFFVDDGGLPANDDSGESDSDAEQPVQASSSSRKPAAWTDAADPTEVSITTGRLRKLRDDPSETTLNGREYESRLRRQFQRINPEPKWAAQARKKSKQAEGEEEADGEDVVKSLLNSTSGIISRSKSRAVLAAGTISMERLRDANQSTQGSGSGEIKCLAFHPSPQVPVLCVGTSDRRVRLYNIDGHTSPLLHTLHVPSIPLTSQSSISFHPGGAQLLLTGNRPYYSVYDLQSGKVTNMGGKNSLWGSQSSTGKRRRDGTTGGDEGSMEVTAFSPSSSSADILAVAGRGGHINLVDWKSGGGQVIGSLKCSNGGGGVKALWWTGDSGSSGKSHLAALTGDAEVYLWDVTERRCVRRWKDDGGFRGTGRVMAGTDRGKGWLAIGSNIGLVNVYAADSFAVSSSDTFSTQPTPLKTVENLTTGISTLRFNHDGQILAMASREKKDAAKLIHLPSLTAFTNWPTSSTPLGHITAMDFSAQSEYLALGNTKGRVLLYHLRNYGST